MTQIDLIFSCFYFLLLGIFEQTRCMKIHDDSNNIEKFKVFIVLMPSAIHLLNIFLNYDMLENR